MKSGRTYVSVAVLRVPPHVTCDVPAACWAVGTERPQRRQSSEKDLGVQEGGNTCVHPSRHVTSPHKLRAEMRPSLQTSDEFWNQKTKKQKNKAGENKL